MPSIKRRSVRFTWVAFGVSGAVALFFLLTEHRAHLFGWLPYLIFLTCPLMHMFMHRSHREHADRNHGSDAATASAAQANRAPHSH